ncbi:MAG: ABC transporter substrate-binding protein, partial [Tepidisphaerales bacterium]
VTVPGGAIDASMRYVISAAGMVPNKDINVVTTGGVGALMTALLAGKLEGALLLSPATEQAVLSGKAKILIDLAMGQGPEALNQPFLVGVVLQSYLQAHPDAVRQVRDAMLEAMAFIRNPANLDRVTQIAQDKVYGGQIDEAVARKSIETLAVTMNHPWFDETDLERVQDVVEKVGAPQAKVTYDQVVATSVVPPAPAK